MQDHTESAAISCHDHKNHQKHDDAVMKK